MNTALEIAPQIGIVAACRGLGVARATFYRAQRPVAVPQVKVPRASSPRALSPVEQHTILEVLHEPAYVDASPRTVFALLLDVGRYLASVSTFYRLLRALGETRVRRGELTHPPLRQARAARPRPARTVVLGYHQAQGAGQVGVLPPLRHPRRL
jgi:putative transposase